MTKKFDRREDETEPSFGPISRRNVLNGALTAGIGFASVTGYATAAEASRAAVHVEEKTGSARKGVLGKALSDSTLRRLRKSFIENGWQPRVGDATVTSTEDRENDVRYHTVTIPFETRVDSEQAVLLWTDSSHFRVQGRHFVHVEDRVWRETSYWVENGSVTARTDEFEVEGLPSGGISIQAWCAPWDIHWACVLAIAGAFASTYAACAACVADPTRITCLGCIGAVLGGGAAIGFCTWCE